MRRSVKVKNPTVLEEEKLRERAKAAFGEVLEATGQENEHQGAKWVKEVEKNNEEKAQVEEDRQKEILEEARKGKERYNKVLENFLQRMVARIDWPKDFSYKVMSDEYGVRMDMWDGNLQKYSRAFKSMGDVKYDYHAAFVLAIQTENVVDKLTGSLVQSPLEKELALILPVKSGKKSAH